MRTIDGLKKVSKAYAKHLGLELKTVSYRVFDDGKKLDAIFDPKAPATLTTDRFDLAMKWFSDNWPDNLPWPEGVNRPAQKAA